MDVFSLKATLGLDTSKYESGLNHAKSLASSIGSGLKTAASVGVAAIGAATTAIGAFGAESVKTGMTFDSSMSQVAATMGKTMDEMANETGKATLHVNGQVKEFSGNLREFAQELGKNTAFSATQAADALNYMALAGYDTQQSMNMLPNVLNLAAAGNFDLARASDMVTDAQTAFGISADRTAQMVDEMAKASSTGNTSVEQLGDAFLVVGGLAQELNGGMVTLADGTQKPVDGLQELEIALTAMANAGVKGGEAGTHMRNMLLKLSSPTDAGTVALEKMGVTVFDTEGKMRSLSDIFSDFSREMDKMTQEEKIQAISDLFNTRDMASAEALLNAVGQDWNKIGESILDAQGAAQKMADTQLDNLVGDITLFKSALEGAKIAVSDVLSPALREFVQFGTDGLQKLTDAFQEKGLSGAMEVFGQVLSDGLKMVTEKLPDFVDAGIQLLGALGQGIMDNLDVLIDAATKIVVKLSEALIKAAPNVVSAGSEIVSALLNALIDVLPEVTPMIVEFITGLAQIFADNAEQMVEIAIAIAGAIGEGLVQSAPILAEKAPEIINAFVEGFKENPEALLVLGPYILSTIMSGVSGAMSVVKTIGPIVTKVMGGSITSSAPALTSSMTGAFTSSASTATAAMGTTTATGGLAALTTAFGSIIAGIGAFLGGAEIGKRVGKYFFPDSEELYEQYYGLKGTWDMMVETFDGIMWLMGEKWNELGTLFKESAAEDWQEIKDGFKAVGDFFADGFNGIKLSFEETKAETMGNLRIMKSQLEEMAITIGEKFTDGKERALNAWADIKEKMSEIWEKIKSAFDIKGVSEWGRDMISNFVDGIRSKIGDVMSAASDIAETVRSYLHFSEPDVGPLKNFHTYAPDMMKLFAKGVADNTDIVSDQLEKSFALPDIEQSFNASNDIGRAGNAYGGITQNVTINAPTQLDPSEIARQTRNASREMVLQLRMV